MLARPGKLPIRGEWAYEVKWDGFRAIASTEGPLRVRSRRGWNMTEHVNRVCSLIAGDSPRVAQRGAPIALPMVGPWRRADSKLTNAHRRSADDCALWRRKPRLRGAFRWSG